MNVLKIVVNDQTYELKEGTFRIEEDGTIILKSEENNPFKRVKEGENFYILDCYGEVVKAREGILCSGPDLYKIANYCSDAELLRRRALYEKLERCLWRFSMENGGSGDYYPVLHTTTALPFWSVTRTTQMFGPSFKTREACERAIEEVIKPMMGNITADEIFVWRGV